jgi:hypothetical protein
MEGGLRVQEGGSGEPVLLLLHGLGATGDVWEGWRPLLARRYRTPAPEITRKLWPVRMIRYPIGSPFLRKARMFRGNSGQAARLSGQVRTGAARAPVP